MRHILFIAFFGILTIYACSSAKKTKNKEIKQGISGVIAELKGNQMPMKGAPPNEPKPIPAATVLIYEPTNLSEVTKSQISPILYTSINTKLVASVQSDSTGKFSVALPPGTYSLFVQQGKLFFANLFDSQNNIQLVTVEADKVTQFNITINSGATY